MVVKKQLGCAFLVESNDLRSSAADASGSERGVTTRPKSVYTRRFHDDRNHGFFGTQGRAGARPGRPGDEGGGSRAKQMAALSRGHVEGKPSALTLVPTEDNLDLSTCLIFGR